MMGLRYNDGVGVVEGAGDGAGRCSVAAVLGAVGVVSSAIVAADADASAACLLYSDRKSTRLNSSHSGESRMPSSA